MSSETTYPITFKRHPSSDRDLEVRVNKGTPDDEILLTSSEPEVKKDFKPVNAKLEFEIVPLGSTGTKMSTLNFSTALDHEFHKNWNNDKKWKLKFKNLDNSFPTNGDPPTNVEVGVNDIYSPKQKK